MHRGFSLVEVVIAVGIFAGSIVIVLSLLPSLVRQSAESADLLIAQRMPDVVQLEVRRQIATVGFSEMAGAVPVMGVPLREGYTFVATADGLRVATVEETGSGRIPEDEQHFLVELWKFHQSPLVYDAGAAVLAVHVRISWPYRIPGLSVPSEVTHRHQFTFNTAINR